MKVDKIERISQPEDLERIRSTPLRPLVWMTSVLVWATVVALFLKVPTWAGAFLCGITGISFLLFLVAYIYLFASDREMLRAERFRARKIVGGARTVESPETTQLSLGDRVEPGLERAGSVVALVGEGKSRAPVSGAGHVLDE